MVNQKIYIKNLEKEIGRRIKTEHKLYVSLHDWIEACFDYKDLAIKNDRLATKLFILGLLLGALLLVLNLLMVVLK